MPQSWTARPLYEVKAGLFQGLTHPYRILILELLADGQEHTVSELGLHTQLEASHLSQHLAVLRKNRLVVSERRGSHVFYRQFSPAVAELLTVARRLLKDLAADASLQWDEVASLPEIPSR
ncbi:ArsR/SmtB family transcription factor [Aestuariimicrobium sp. T2.26MG-19.2B]|uniref:ArsR/SmtB family transcription factor n=1 Tax=Aestuariimicrobium sp. T2.26MG-19.2B TaxID=3040679 RepID=UPI002477C8DA|nr:metalloregulator ArsR/SmtB family transcription factor [Aestuariimicrobium sp. T2.26MG-19.2B]CAI9409360.1 hypothetical protein AESSP_02220 [Aestuariimicrobium sp. T2.26MG-19.2B]